MPEAARDAARYYASWFVPPEHLPTIEEALESLSAARLEVWRTSHMARSRLERVEQNLLTARREVEALLLSEDLNM
jgi:hypothetical protein